MFEKFIFPRSVIKSLTWHVFWCIAVFSLFWACFESFVKMHSCVSFGHSERRKSICWHKFKKDRKVAKVGKRKGANMGLWCIPIDNYVSVLLDLVSMSNVLFAKLAYQSSNANTCLPLVMLPPWQNFVVFSWNYKHNLVLNELLVTKMIMAHAHRIIYHQVSI